MGSPNQIKKSRLQASFIFILFITLVTWAVVGCSSNGNNQPLSLSSTVENNPLPPPENNLTQPKEETVLPLPPPSVQFSATKTNLNYLESTDLQYTSQNAEHCDIRNGNIILFEGSGDGIKSGALTLGPLTTSKTYHLRCTNGELFAEKEMTIQVAAAPNPVQTQTEPALPVLNFNISNTRVRYGSEVTLDWLSTNLINNSCTLQQNGINLAVGLPTNGSFTVRNIILKPTFNLTCLSPSQSLSRVISIELNAHLNLSNLKLGPSMFQPITIGELTPIDNIYLQNNGSTLATSIRFISNDIVISDIRNCDKNGTLKPKSELGTLPDCRYALSGSPIYVSTAPYSGSGYFEYNDGEGTVRTPDIIYTVGQVNSRGSIIRSLNVLDFTQSNQSNLKNLQTRCSGIDWKGLQVFRSETEVGFRVSGLQAWNIWNLNSQESPHLSYPSFSANTTSTSLNYAYQSLGGNYKDEIILTLYSNGNLEVTCHEWRKPPATNTLTLTINRTELIMNVLAALQ